MTPENIKVGEGDCFIQFAGENAPRNIGYCRNADLEYKFGTLKVSAGNRNFPINSFDINAEASFEIEMLESTIENLVSAMGGDPSDIVTENDGSKTYKIPGGSVTSSKFLELTYKTLNVHDKTKQDIYTFYKMKSEGGVKFSLRKDKESFYKVKFMAYASDEGDNDGSPGVIQFDVPVS